MPGPGMLSICEGCSEINVMTAKMLRRKLEAADLEGLDGEVVLAIINRVRKTALRRQCEKYR